MRKFFLFVAATAVAMSFTFVYANNIVIHVKETGQTMTPRSEMPVITASIDNGICRTEMSDYVGNVVVTVEDATGDTLVTQTETVCDSTQFTTDVSNLNDGNYTITYTLEDSTAFCGEFEKE